MEQKQLELQTLRDGIRIPGGAIEEKKRITFGVAKPFCERLELLDDYDHEKLDAKGLSKKQAVYPDIQEYKKWLKP